MYLLQVPILRMDNTKSVDCTRSLRSPGDFLSVVCSRSHLSQHRAGRQLVHLLFRVPLDFGPFVRICLALPSGWRPALMLQKTPVQLTLRWSSLLSSREHQELSNVFGSHKLPLVFLRAETAFGSKSSSI